MVLATGRFPFEEDGGILALLRARRAEADAALPRSLLTSSLSLLTFVVALLIAQTAFHGDSARVIEIPLVPPGPAPHVSKHYAPISDVVTPLVPTSKLGEIVPVQDDPKLDSPPVIDRTEAGVTPGQGEVQAGPHGSDAPPGVPKPDPNPGDYVPYDDQPEVVTRVVPEYPSLAREAGMEGTVVLRLLVGVDGRVKRAEIESSAALFDETALAAGRQWIFTPARASGHPVVVWVRVPMRFRLR